MLETGTRLDLKIEDVAYRGPGIARHEGLVIFVPRVAPGERIEAELSRERQAALQLRVGELVHARPSSFASFPLHAQQSALNVSLEAKR